MLTLCFLPELDCSALGKFAQQSLPLPSLPRSQEPGAIGPWWLLDWWAKGFFVKQREMLAAEWWLLNLLQSYGWLPMEFSYEEGGVSKLGGPCWAQHVACPDSRERGLTSITFRS